ncbi:hypothetical protein EMEDMD4_150128 [Sinorhizobium medicae]|uniref:Uncharacterized protein n=1 Tax=Sinorhizobium medicae TaxID=110321 RepID=A0A508WU85_9HYPH|nr:hypothetical protein EMEDMD4_150128 [Sinorhizobium medicae]
MLFAPVLEHPDRTTSANMVAARYLMGMNSPILLPQIRVNCGILSRQSIAFTLTLLLFLSG